MTDVIVIGGGPAGSTAGTILARLGYEVLLLEKEAFPRHHIGESLLPSSLAVLESIGVMDEVRAAGFPVKRGGMYVWGRSRKPWLFRFGELKLGSAFQVERARFDQILLEHARRSGVDVRERNTVVETLEEDGRVRGVAYVDESGQRKVARAKWVLDASGQAGFLARHRGTRRVNEDLKSIAVYGYWRGPRALELTELCPEATADDRNSIFIEAVEAGWCWWIPLGEEHFSVGFVAGRDALKGSASVKDFYERSLGQTEYVARLLARARLEDPLRSTRDWSYTNTEYCGPGFLLLGDAAAFIDPILSTGVFLALNSAAAAATVVHTSERGLLPEDRCLGWYGSVYDAVYRDYEAMVRHWYFGERTQESWFWRARRVLEPVTDAGFREAFVLIAAGESHDVFKSFVSAQQGVVTHVSSVGSLGAMGSPTPLRRLASALALDLPEVPAQGPDQHLRLVLTPRDDWTLSYALARPDGSCRLISVPEADALLSALETG